jgi:hypothetical protein
MHVFFLAFSIVALLLGSDSRGLFIDCLAS